ncbi:hypothetical protein [Nocardia suismassiliense]|nr:hypothetical protein [Nocardia suismassiliense]
MSASIDSAACDTAALDTSAEFAATHHERDRPPPTSCASGDVQSSCG